MFHVKRRNARPLSGLLRAIPRLQHRIGQFIASLCYFLRVSLAAPGEQIFQAIPGKSRHRELIAERNHFRGAVRDMFISSVGGRFYSESNVYFVAGIP